MTLLHRMRNVIRKFGVDLHRFDPVQSPQARLIRLLEHHDIDLVLDVGAGAGGFGRHLRDGGFRGEILSFEPLSEAHEALSQAATKDPRWHVAQRMALGDAAGSMQIHISHNSTSSSLLPMEESHVSAAPASRYVGTEEVVVHRLETVVHPILKRGGRIYLKIDAQGYEMPVLKGAEALLADVRGVQVELSLISLYSGQVLYRDVLDWLDQQGFELWNVIPGFSNPESGRMLQMDGVLFRR